MMQEIVQLERLAGKVWAWKVFGREARTKRQERRLQHGGAGAAKVT
jgi:hypothetical protein